MEASNASPPAATRREWLGLAVLMLPTVLLALDMTVLHLAVPQLSADLHPTSDQLLWILDIYGFMIAGFLVTMGTLGDRVNCCWPAPPLSVPLRRWRPSPPARKC